MHFSSFFFNHTSTTEIYTLSLHDALPISRRRSEMDEVRAVLEARLGRPISPGERSEEHTSELQSRVQLVCCLLLEKKKKMPKILFTHIKIKRLNFKIISIKQN